MYREQQRYREQQFGLVGDIGRKVGKVVTRGVVGVANVAGPKD